MAITDRDRKLLWGRAHNRCAMCRSVLTPDSDSEPEEAIVADEAHIIARSPAGPRGGDGDRADIDGYGNVILLCKNHHKAIDDMPWTYPVDRVLQIKTEHESWAESLFDENKPEPVGPTRIVTTADEDKILFKDAASGAQVWNVLSNAAQCNIGYPLASMGAERLEIANEALASLQEYSEIAGEITVNGYRAVSQSVKELDDILRTLTAANLVLILRLLPRHVTGGVGAPMSWNVAELLVHTTERIQEIRNEDLTAPG
ncbi:HNH endonuclease signature motif containing protein [Cryobacterium sp. Hh38]|uniref:HNH endonuclease signature motif containing protein n=1 Tax=Cryobacterium sp. Hh38 TaxID=1259156 RepID=UPI0010695E45|nr:HNH endonuclease signature motif containing protein [Cryobacterium sp. Hh38]TFD65495.1 HNH endonuclease [Cryobacterium sp. Hh38]